MTEHEIISALRQAASAEQTAALVAALYVVRSRTTYSIATSAYQNGETIDADRDGRAERRLRAA
ncbi:MAG TPA: hypothetical protein VFU65_17935 [Actinocrinis sp.]|nr:hypothetical protein [Actinocrinis sp.]